MHRENSPPPVLRTLTHPYLYTVHPIFGTSHVTHDVGLLTLEHGLSVEARGGAFANAHFGDFPQKFSPSVVPRFLGV